MEPVVPRCSFCCYLLSYGLGVGIGLLVALVVKWPRERIGAIAVLVLAVLSPYAFGSTALIAIDNNVYILVNPIWVGMLFTILLGYILRVPPRIRAKQEA